jgi:hypothetical protein
LNSQQRIGVGVGYGVSGGLLLMLFAASSLPSSHQLFVEEEEDFYVEFLAVADNRTKD